MIAPTANNPPNNNTNVVGKSLGRKSRLGRFSKKYIKPATLKPSRAAAIVIKVSLFHTISWPYMNG